MTLQGLQMSNFLIGKAHLDIECRKGKQNYTASSISGIIPDQTHITQLIQGQDIIV